MSLKPETVTILRAAKTRDAAGGLLETWAAVPGLVNLQATRNYYRKSSNVREEQGAHNTEGPGVLTATSQFFTFRSLTLDIRVNDRIKALNGDILTVHFVRQYSRTLQVDCEIVS